MAMIDVVLQELNECMQLDPDHLTNKGLCSGKLYFFCIPRIFIHLEGAVNGEKYFNTLTDINW